MIKVRDARPDDLAACAAMAVDSEIGHRYGFETGTLQARMSAAMDSGATIVIAELEAGTGIGSPFGGASPKGEPQDEKSLRGASSASLVGFAWVDPRGAFGSAPYLKLIAVDASARSSGIGAALLAEFEKRTAGQGRLWTLLVSDFNTRAQAFYASHGYREAGRLAGFAIEGVAEIIMVKAKT